jgi:RNA polymerase sigma-70 factor (ECF subfamily)
MGADGLEPEEDARLVAAVAGGDKQALATLYDRHARVLLALGLRILRDRTAAEDVLHDVFLEAWHQAGAFDPARGTVRAWLVMRMRSRALDRQAQIARRARLADEAARAGEPAVAGAATGESGATEVDQQRVQRGVAELPAELAAVVERAYFHGLSSSEIAAELGIPLGTVKSRMARALAILRERLLPGRGGTSS